MTKRLFSWVVGGGLLVGLTGCGSGVSVPGPLGNPVDGNRDASLTSAAGKTSGEPNDTFAQAVSGVFDISGVARLQGTVSRVGDLDVYRLGSVEAGDRIVVDTRTPGSVLDVTVALFDESQRLTYSNDDRNDESSRSLDAYIDWVVRAASHELYLVVTGSPFAASGTFTGGYELDVFLSHGAPIPPPVQQVLLLDFDGGNTAAATLEAATIAPFDAEAIGRAYRGQTALMKGLIIQVVRQNFERFDVAVFSSDDPPLPEGVEFSTVFFGGFNAGAFGIAESVDLYNVDYCDDAIIYTESFSPTAFSRLPSVSGMATAIGNVAAHEAGHLLGLSHVSDDRALMDDRSAADAFLDDQEFMEAPLSTDVMAIGTQNAVMLLDQIVGALKEEP